METIAFYGFGALSVIASLLIITRRQPVAAVMWLVVLVLGVAGLFFSLQAEFLGVMQFFLYGDAITVIFIFIIMAMNIPDEQLPIERLSIPAVVAIIVSGLAAGVYVSVLSTPMNAESPSGEFGSLSSFAKVMFESQLLAFEAVSVLLLVAMIGVVVLSKKSVVE